MTKYFSLALSVVALSACSITSERLLDDGSYEISSFTGSPWVSTDDLRKNISEEAEDVCGKDNFEFVSKEDFDSQVNRVYINGRFEPSHERTVKRNIRCKVEPKNIVILLLKEKTRYMRVFYC